MGTTSQLAHFPKGEAEPVPRAGRRAIFTGGVLLVLAVFLAYSNSFFAPFVYDDKESIPDNPTLLHLWPPWEALSPPPGGATVSGRPVLNFSFAINRALTGTGVQGYHAGNLLIHICAGLVLFGLVRRTLLQPGLRRRFGDAAMPLAFLIATLWSLHPLQTEAVTYLVQRAESLMGLLYLLTLYGFIRGVQSATMWSGYGLSVAACVLGMGTKEVMASVPLMVLLFDRTFVAGTFLAAWRQRRTYYLCVAATWIPLAFLVMGNGGNRGGSIGFGIGLSWWKHTLTQFEAVARYLQLSVWPHPLVFDYGASAEPGLREILPCAVIVSGLVLAIAFALWRRPVLGFLGAWFLVILAPSSLMPGPIQMIVEHRLYLSLAAVMALLVMGIYRLGGRASLAALLLVTIALGGLTFRRNHDYRTDLALWQDTLVKRPDNAIAHANLGTAFSSAGRKEEAIVEFEAALALNADSPEAHLNLGEIYSAAGQHEKAMPHLLAAIRMLPNRGEAHLNLGTALDRLGRTSEAMEHYQQAMRLKPMLPEPHNNVGDVLLRLDQPAAALPHLQEALRLKPDYPEAHYNLASVLAKTGRLDEATAQFEIGRQLQPGNAVARHSWANALSAAGRRSEAIAEFETVLKLKPDYAEVRYDYGNALALAGQMEGAVAQYDEAVRLKPDYGEAHNNMGNALSMLGRNSEAIVHYQAAINLKPDNPRARNNLGLVFARLGRFREAIALFEAAARLDPNYQEARDNLARAQDQLRAGPSRR